MATDQFGDRPLVPASPFDSMRERVEVAAAFQRWLHENGHTDQEHCSGCAAYYARKDP
jgi:hypothetical protein